MESSCTAPAAEQTLWQNLTKSVSCRKGHMQHAGLSADRQV